MSEEHIPAADGIRIAELVDMENPHSVLDEVKTIVCRIFPKFDFEPVERVFDEVVGLFRGEYPGYGGCNTEYHDLEHITDVMLAMTRLIHGTILQGEIFCQKHVSLGLISSLFHDTGYIQTLDDDSGTGAKYTMVHIQRSIEFMEKYFMEKGFPREDFENCRDIIHCTGFRIKINEIQFKTREIELLGKMLGTADLLGQMADRIYLEKLLFLFYEFREGDVGDYATELDLLKKTLDFYDLMEKRLANELSSENKYMIFHFRKRWNIDRDLYEDAIKRNRDYLRYILANHEEEYRDYLRRSGIVKKLDEEGTLKHSSSEIGTQYRSSCT